MYIMDRVSVLSSCLDWSKIVLISILTMCVGMTTKLVLGHGMSVMFKRVVLGVVFVLFCLFGLLFWLNTVSIEKSKSLYPGVVSASNAYYLYKKNPTPEALSNVLLHEGSRVGRTYAISVLRENSQYDRIAATYLKTLSDFSNFDMYQIFVYSIDIDMYYRDRFIRKVENNDYEIIGRLDKNSRDRLFNCYKDLKARYSYPWSKMLVPVLGRPVENFDYFFDVHSKNCH